MIDTRVFSDATTALTRKHGFDMAWFGERVEPDALVVGYRSGAISRLSDKTLVRPGLGLGGLIFSSNKVRSVDDYLDSPDITHHYDERIKAESLQRLMGAPVWADGTCFGVLMVGSRDGATFGTAATALVERAASDLSDSLLATILRQRLVALERAARETAEALRALHVRGATTLGALRDRERDVLVRVALGKTNGEIAQAMQIGECTVKSYLHNAMRRLGARNRTEAVAFARSAGQI